MDKKFLILISIPAIVIIGFILSQALIIAEGEEILLEVPRPVDPTDLFRGNYVTLFYDITNIDVMNIGGDNEFEREGTIYAVLTKKEKYWTPDYVFKTRPSIDASQSCIKGKVTHVTKGSMRIEWGIESFFSPTEKAKEIEKEQRIGSIGAIVVVDPGCNSVLKALVLSNETVQTR